jgi:hypothetical protein
MLFLSRQFFQRQISDAFLQRAGLATQILDLIGAGGARRIASQAALAGLHELLRPGVVEALRDPFLAAKLGDAVFAAQTVQHDPDLVFCREMPPGRPANVFHHLLGRLLGACGLEAHLGSFVMQRDQNSP